MNISEPCNQKINDKAGFGIKWYSLKITIFGLVVKNAKARRYLRYIFEVKESFNS